MFQPTRRGFVGSAFAGPLVAAPQHPAESHPALLSGAWTLEKLSAALLPRDRWRPFPPASDRDAWQALPADRGPRLIDRGERRAGAPWPTLPATAFLEYKRNGNRSNYERIRGERRAHLADLVLAECAEAKGRFLDDIADGIWVTCEETFWGVPAHLGLQRAGTGLPDVAEPVVDLFAGETASLLAWAEYLLGPALNSVSPLVGERIRIETDRRVLTPCFDRVDFWWMGLDPKGRDVNNWNPWINSNWLTAALLLERDPERRSAAVHKILHSLDAFLAAYHEDGGCDEGPSYWFRAGGSLFDCLELLRSASGGAIDFYSLPLVREIGRYIYRAHIANDWVIDFADASAKLKLSGGLIFRYGRRIADPRMQALGAWAAARNGVVPGGSDSLGRILPALFDREIADAPKSQPMVRDVWLPGIQVMAARMQDGSAQGLYLAAQGGHNAESHNHNDVGNFIVYADGVPAIIDIGVETYSAKTFSPRRYEIWTMQSAWHNLPTIDGVMQGAGRQFAAREVAYRSDDTASEFRLDIAKAYPPQAGVSSWNRVLRLDRGRAEIDVRDSCVLAKAARRIAWTLMCAVRPLEVAAGELRLDGGYPSGPVRIIYDPRALTVSIEAVTITDGRLRASWGDRLYRVLLTADRPPARGAWSTRITQTVA